MLLLWNTNVHFCPLPLYLHQSHELINGLLLSWELLLQAFCHLSLPCMDMVLSGNDRSEAGRSEMDGNVEEIH